MLEGKKIKGVKNASISIEITLSLVMGVAVLFMVLGLWGNNVAKVAANTGMSNLFDKENQEKKIEQVKKYDKVDPTSTQVNVQLVGEQGLNYYLSQAEATIQKYKTTPPETEEQTQDLARAAAIADLYDKISDDDRRFFANNKVKVQETLSYVQAGDKRLYYEQLNNKEDADLICQDILKTDFEN